MVTRYAEWRLDMGTLYLPGDRDIYAPAEAAYRDSLLNDEERYARLAAYRCKIRKENSHIAWEFAGPWRCTFRKPCIYCGSLR